MPFIVEAPTVGWDYPGSLPELRRWFTTDSDCVDYLDWLQWPEGFCCPWCAGVGDWSIRPDAHRCSDCGRCISASLGTIFHSAKTPFTVWFEAAWLMMSSKQSLPAQGFARVARRLSGGLWARTKFRSVTGSDVRRMLSDRIGSGRGGRDVFIDGTRRVGGAVPRTRFWWSVRSNVRRAGLTVITDA